MKVREPERRKRPDRDSKFNFAQNIAYDTSRIRNELGYCEPIPEEEALAKTLNASLH